MTVEVVIESGVEREFKKFLSLLEHVGFFLARWDRASNRFIAHDWRPIEGAEYAQLSDFHVSLGDDVKTNIIQWAWQAGDCLIETHSHGERGIARFSPSDLSGFHEWVPHLWWRLHGRPYAALVTTGETIDGLAWTSDPTRPEQVEKVHVGSDVLETTRATWPILDSSSYD